MHSNKSQTPPGNCPFRTNFFFKFIEYLMACLGLAIALGPQTLQSQDCTSQPVTTGYRDFNFGSSIHYQPTAAKPESKLWWNDGFWWGSLWSTSANTYRIHRFDWGNQCWQNTGPDIDDRTKSLADALWDGSYLYIASHMAKTSSGPARLYRYSYSSGSKSYSLDGGFPVQVNNESSETLTLAKDSAGKLWVSWTADNNIMINRSIGNDQTWGVPFVLPVQGAPVASDDISAIVAFGDNKIGIMWSNQIERKMYFAFHLDGQADASWQPREAVLEDPNLALADDHINLKVMPDDGGNVYAVTKTSLTGSNDPLIYVLKRASNGQCTRYVFGTHADNHTRPSLLIDEENRRLYVFAMSVRSTPHLIYMKSTSLDNISFSSGLGTVFLQSATDQEINNPTSTKQNLNGTTNLLVLASDEDSNNYLHNYIDLPGGSGNNPPVAVDDPVQTGKDTPVEINVTGNDTDADGIIDVSSVAIASFPANGAIFVNATTGVVTYTPHAGFAGVDSFSYTVNDDDGAVSNAALVTITVGLESATLTFNPSDDAYVRSSSPTTNYGSATFLRLRSGDPQYISYLKFNVTGLHGQIQNAKLRLYVTDPGASGGSLYSVSNTYQSSSASWEEGGLTWNNAPVISGMALSSLGSLAVNTWVELEVTSVIAANGIYSFGINNSTTNSVYYSSKEGAYPPELVIDIIPGGSGNNPPVANDDTAETTAGAPVAIDVLANDTDVDDNLDPTTVTVAVSPGQGVITAINSSTGAITYTPDAGFEGMDTFAYTVSDEEGEISNSGTVTVTVVGSGNSTTVTFNPSDDAHVYASSPSTNYGANAKLRLRSSDPQYNTYLKFNVAGLSGQIQDAKLRLYVTNAGPDGGAVYAVSNNYVNSATPWIEEGLRWSNAPVLNGAPLSQAGALTLDTWVELNVTSAITGNGVYSFGMSNNSTNTIYYSSKEGENPPQLVIQTSGSSGNNPPVANNDAATTSQNTAVSIDVLVNDSDADGALDPVTVTVVSVPSNGTITGINSATGVITYTPDAGYVGSDTFTYTVNDAAGVTSNVASVDLTISASGPVIFTFIPSEDAYVYSPYPSKSYGANTKLRLRDPDYNSYLKFDVTGLSGQVQSAKLRLYVTNASPDGGSVYSVSNNYASSSTPWVEQGLTWNNAPAIDDTSLSQLGSVDLNTWVEFNVTTAILGDGVYSFAMTSTSANSVFYSSKEDSQPPQLVIETSAGTLTASTEDHLMRETANDTDLVSSLLLPQRFALSQNYPNPFNAHTIIKYALPDEVHVRLVIYDLAGNEVITLVDQIQPLGFKQTNWDGKNRYGQEVASGVYFYLLQAGRQKIARNMTWLK